MRKHELDDDKFIFPRGVWECFICLQPKRNLEVFEDADSIVYLICATCKFELTHAFREAETLEINRR